MSIAQRIKEFRPQMSQTATVYVLDDDLDTCRTVSLLLEREGYLTHAYSSGDEFLSDFANDSLATRCLVLDFCMPGMDGLQLLEVLNRNGIRIPVIFVTGRDEIPVAVEAFKLGAMDYLRKPFHVDRLKACVAKAIEADTERVRIQVERNDARSRLERLTPREREICRLLARGLDTKGVGGRLGISTKTVFVHRARVLEKLNIDNLVMLSRLVAAAEIS